MTGDREAHVVLYLDTASGRVGQIAILSTSSLKAHGNGITTLPVLGLSTTGTDYQTAHDECALMLGTAAWLFGQPGEALRDAVDRVVEGGDGEVSHG